MSPFTEPAGGEGLASTDAKSDSNAAESLLFLHRSTLYIGALQSSLHPIPLAGTKRRVSIEWEEREKKRDSSFPPLSIALLLARSEK